MKAVEFLPLLPNLSLTLTAVDNATDMAVEVDGFEPNHLVPDNAQYASASEADGWPSVSVALSPWPVGAAGILAVRRPGLSFVACVVRFAVDRRLGSRVSAASVVQPTPVHTLRRTNLRAPWRLGWRGCARRWLVGGRPGGWAG